MSQPIPDAQRAQILEALADGVETRRQIARRFGVTIGQVAGLAHRGGITRPERNPMRAALVWTREKRQQLASMWRGDATMADIMAAMGCGESAIRVEISRMRAGGWVLPPRTHITGPRAEALPPSATLATAAPSRRAAVAAAPRAAAGLSPSPAIPAVPAAARDILPRWRHAVAAVGVPARVHVPRRASADAGCQWPYEVAPRQWAFQCEEPRHPGRVYCTRHACVAYEGFAARLAAQQLGGDPAENGAVASRLSLPKLAPVAHAAGADFSGAGA